MPRKAHNTGRYKERPERKPETKEAIAAALNRHESRPCHWPGCTALIERKPSRFSTVCYCPIHAVQGAVLSRIEGLMPGHKSALRELVRHGKSPSEARAEILRATGVPPRKHCRK